MLAFFQNNLSKVLEPIDFIRFSSQFVRVIHENIPTISGVTFLNPPPSLPAHSSTEGDEERALREGVEEAVSQGSPVVCQGCLLLPFMTTECTIVAQAHGLDDYLIRKIGQDWLAGISVSLLREFLLVKRASIDSLTGLLNSLHLEEYLDGLGYGEGGAMVLVSVYPKSSCSFQARKYQHRTISLLKSIIEDRFPLYYLGQSCYGIICDGGDPDGPSGFAPSLLNSLKRASCSRVHVGSASFSGHLNGEDSALSLSEEVMKRASAALYVATKRGPFAFCHYSSIEDAANHPLALPAPATVRWLRRVTRNLLSCSLLHFDVGDKTLGGMLVRCAGEEGISFVTDDAVYLLLADLDGEEAVVVGKRILGTFYEGKDHGAPINCGVSTFPQADFKKSELLLNCKKALCHAAFLTPGSVVLCDAVSCNIAGDLYYGEGDLVLSVKEYRRGLLLDPGNGTLLNSLGVCYAQMNRHKMAIECFLGASRSPEDQFMALYNLGLELQIEDEEDRAMESFRKALALPCREGEDQAREDIVFQLAVLCIRGEHYQEGLGLMEPWYLAQQRLGKGELALRYLGKAMSGLGRQREAMKYLQQALGHDEYDADVLGLLGEMYLDQNQGDEIALRFCEKAVELNPDSPYLHLRLAKAQSKNGDFGNALKNLQPCLRNLGTRPEALRQRGYLARQQGQQAAARRWFAKADACLGDAVALEM